MSEGIEAMSLGGMTKDELGSVEGLLVHMKTSVDRRLDDSFDEHQKLLGTLLLSNCS